MQLGLAEADHLRSVVLQQVIDDLLFGLLVQSSDIEGNEIELIPLIYHFSEISVNLLSCTIGECILPIFSVASIFCIAASIFCGDFRW